MKQEEEAWTLPPLELNINLSLSLSHNLSLRWNNDDLEPEEKAEVIRESVLSWGAGDVFAEQEREEELLSILSFEPEYYSEGFDRFGYQRSYERHFTDGSRIRVEIRSYDFFGSYYRYGWDRPFWPSYDPKSFSWD